MADLTRYIKLGGAFERPVEPIQFGSSSAPPPAPATNIGPAATQGTTGAFLPSTQSSPQTAAPVDPTDAFNSLMLDLLKSAQGVGTADLLKRKRELQREVTGRGGSVTDKDIRTLSPSQQSSIRSGSMSALSPEIDANAYEIEKAQQSIDSFFKVFGEAQKMSADFAEKMVAPESVIQNAKKVIEADPDSLATILASFNDKSRQKILESLDYGAIKAASDKKTSGGLTPGQTATFTAGLRDDIRNDPDVKDFVQIRDGYERVKSGSSLGSGPGDIAVIFGYMKMLDPSSVVRETEFDTAESAIGYAQKVLNIPSKFISGTRLTPEGRKFFVTAAQKLYETKKVNYDNASSFYEESAGAYGIPFNTVMRDFSSQTPDSNGGNEIDQMRSQLQSGELLVSREGPDGRYYAAITPDELWATDIKL